MKGTSDNEVKDDDWSESINRNRNKSRGESEVKDDDESRGESGMY